MPWLASPHDEAATRWWMAHVVLAGQRVRVALDGGRVVGFAAVDGDWLAQLYVDPDHQGAGVGRALLDDAVRARPEGLSLRVFQRNIRARHFYEAAGFTLVDEDDGSRNEEREADCTYTWSPP
ncbi:GNAT family N-acetyltransferase [Modestobacter roseus]|nr:GNAT family N-acetyltransferase [Modestobacter roseus]